MLQAKNHAHVFVQHRRDYHSDFCTDCLLFLSQQMHDEVSETENIRKNLAIERIIIGGCDILLDVNQVFVRQGALLHLQSTEKHKHQRTRLGSFRGDRDVVRQCFLFTNHMLMCTRASNGKLHLAEVSIFMFPLNLLFAPLHSTGILEESN